ncbi:MAG TPA: hypothetical protein VF008_10625 [Niastella sp.]
MKKTTTLLTGFLLLTIILHAQNKQPKYLAEIALGPSFPLGRFASTEFKDGEVPGFAKSGISTQLSLGYYLKESIGVMLIAGYAAHPQDEKDFKAELEKDIPGLTVNKMDLKSWRTLKLMAGGFWVTPLTAESELALRTKLTAGVAKSAVPEVDFSGTGPGTGVTSSGHGDRTSLPWGFCYQVSVAMEYKLNSNLHLLLDINSFNTTIKDKISFTDQSSGTTTTVNLKYKQPAVNVMAGVGLNF